MIYDTGSEKIIVKSSDCSACLLYKLEITDSTTFNYYKPKGVTFPDSETYEDGIYLKGKVATDRVCPSTDTSGCSTDQKLTAITEEKGLGANKDGVLGLFSGNETG